MTQKKNPTNEEYLVLMRKYQAAETTAEKNKYATIILEGLSRLIWMLVKRRTHWMSEAVQEDCFAEANLAIFKSAFKNYDEEKLANCKVSNYMVNWGMQAVSRYLDQNDSPVSIPVNGRQAVRKMLKEGKEIPEKMQAYIPQFVYWDKPPKNDDGSERTLRDIISEKEGVCVEPEAVDKISAEQSIKLANKLLSIIDNKRDLMIVRLHMKGHSLGDIGSVVGLSRQGVSNAYNKWLVEMHKYAKTLEPSAATQITTANKTLARIAISKERDAARERRKLEATTPQSAKPKKIRKTRRTKKHVPKPEKGRSDEVRISSLCRETLSRRCSKRAGQRLAGSLE